MSMSKYVTNAVFLAAGLATLPTGAEVLTIEAGGGFPGTLIREGTPTTNNAGSNEFFAGTVGPGDDTRTVLSFDLSSITNGSTIDSVELTFTVFQPDGGTSFNADTDLILQKLDQTPTEAANWNTYDGTNAWVTAGGDFSGPALSTATANPDTITANTDVVFGSTSDLTALAKTAVDDDTNFNLILRAPGLEAQNSRGLFRFAGTGDPNERFATLVVNYTVPEPGSLGLIAAGAACLILRRRQ